MRFRMNDSSSFLSGASDYQYAGHGGTTSIATVADANDTEIELSEAGTGADLGIAGGEKQHGYLFIPQISPIDPANFVDSKPAQGNYFTCGWSSAGHTHFAEVNFFLDSGFNNSQAGRTIAGIQFSLNGTGSFIGGNLKLYGVL